MLKKVDNMAYDYDIVEDEDRGTSLWIAGADGKPCINIIIQIDDDGVEVRMWPMDGTENLTEVPSRVARLDFDEVKELKHG